MNLIITRLKYALAISVISILVMGNLTPAASTPLRVGILPFQVNAPQDLSYLKNGIVDMLTSRLTWEGNVTVSPAPAKDPVNEQTVKDIGSQSGLDYLVFGSLTVLGNSISIDAKVIDITGKKPIRTFFIQSSSMDEVIPKIDLLATDINQTIFGRSVIADKTPPAAEPKRPIDESRAHPDKLAQGGFEDRTTHPSDLGPESAFSRRIEGITFWKSPNFSHLINGLAVGDVNGDDRMETVVVTPHTVFIYTVENNRMAEIQKIEMGRFIYIIGVDVADINGNGYSEIFATALNAQKNAVTSFVLEYDGQKFRTISEKLPWFFRVVRFSRSDSILLGQRGIVEDPFSGKIFQMAWKGAEYNEEKPILISEKLNLLGLTLGDIQNNGQNLPVAFDRQDYIHIFDASGKTISKGGDRLGGGTLYYHIPKENPDVDNWAYLPVRILISDINSDGKREAIVAGNQELAGRLLEQFRQYTKGKMTALSWDGIGLISIWETREISGAIRDFSIADFDNDGKEELVCAVVMKEGAIAFTDPKSAVIAYELGEIKTR